MSHSSAIQDRTPEFRAILAHARKTSARQKPKGPQSQPLLPPSQQQQQHLLQPQHASDTSSTSSSPPTRTQRSEFARTAALIGRGISATMGKLQRLGELARRKTLFDDRPVEIAELTFVIKQDLAGLNQQIAKLSQLQRGQQQQQQQQKQGGTAGLSAGQQQGEHSKNVVVLLQGRLADVGVHFKEVLEVRTKNIQASRMRQENFVSGVSAQQQQGQGQVQARLDTARTDSPLYGAPPPMSSRGRSPKPGNGSNGTIASSNGGNNATDLLSLDPSPSSTSALYPGNSSQHQLQLLEEGVSAPSAYLNQRGEAIEAIERTIGELGGIFTQLATMVSEQAEQIQRIDANTDDVVDNVDGAQRELMKYWGRMQGNRWLVAKMMGVLMVFFLVWVLVAG